MGREYDVDEILAEVRRKRGAQERQPEARREPAAAPRPVSGGARGAGRAARPAQDRLREQPSPWEQAEGFQFDAPEEPQPRRSFGERPGRRREPEPEAFAPYAPAEEEPQPRRSFGERPSRRREPEPEAFAPYAPAEEEPLPPPEDYAVGFTQSGEFDFRQEPAEAQEELPPLGEERWEEAYTQEVEASGGSLAHSRWRQPYAEQERLETPAEEDEFASPEDAPFVEKDLRGLRTGLRVKLFFTGLLTLLSFYLALSLRPLALAERLGVPNGLLFLPPFMLPEENMRLFLIVNLVLCVLGAVVCSGIVGGGIMALLRLRANGDTPAALAVLAAVVQGAVLTALPDTVYASDSISLYFCVALAALWCNLWGKSLLLSRVARNLRTLTGGRDKYAFVQIQNREFAREFARGLGPEVNRVAYSVKSDFLMGFLEKSYAPDYSETFHCFAAPVSLLGALVVAVASFLLGDGDLPVAVSGFTAVLCVCAPFSSTLVPNLMLNRVSKGLARGGQLLAGYETAEELSETDAVVLNDKDLFLPENIMIHGMKVFAEKRIDEAILDAASVVISCDGILSGVFLNMVGGNRRMLKPVENLAYEDGLGISAWVSGKRVLIGSRDLMHHHGIDCPSKDFESRYVRDGRRVFYIASSGELSAMFVVSYNPDPDRAQQLAELQRRGVSVVVHTTDPNLTVELIAGAFGLKRTGLKVLPAKLHAEYGMLTQPKARIAAGAAHSGGAAGVLSLLRAAAAVRASVMHGAVAQVIGIVAGYGLVAFMAFTSSLSLASSAVLLGYGLVWMLLTAVVCSAVSK